MYIWTVSALGQWLFQIALAIQHLILDELSGDYSAHLMPFLAVDSVLEEFRVPGIIIIIMTMVNIISNRSYLNVYGCYMPCF